MKRLSISNYWILRVKTHLRCLVFANRNQWPWFLVVLPDLHSSSSRSACSNSTNETINRSNFGYLFREAHPVNGWDINSPNRITDPQTIEERRQVATECAQATKYGIRTCIDEIHDPVMMAYAAWPDRLYLIDMEGKVAYSVGVGVGPSGFKPIELQQAIINLLVGISL